MDKRSLLFVVGLTCCLFFINHWFHSKEEAKKPSQAPQIVEQTMPLPSTTTSPKSFLENSGALYVLENDVQQVVFSTDGGAISEINLPFKSDKNTKSLVLPIGFDRTMDKEYPYNDLFPSKPFYIWKNGQVQKLTELSTGGYYPLLRRNVLGRAMHPLHSMPTQNFAFQVISDTEPFTASVYQVTRFEKNLIEFQLVEKDRKITKTFSLAPENTPYCLEVEIKVEGDSRGLWVTTGIPEVELISDNFSPVLKYLVNKNQKTQVESLSLPKAMTSYSSIVPNWVSNSNGFLGLIIQPMSENTAGFRTRYTNGASAPTRLSVIDAQYDLYPTDKYPGYEFLMPLRPSQTTKFRYFAGPYQDGLFEQIDTALASKEGNPHFVSALSFQGWFTFISEPFAKFLFILMKFFYQITHSWGFSIIFLTIALRVMLYPLNGWSIKSSLKMQQIAPLTAAIQEKYKKDPKKAQMEIVALYRDKGVNPLTGCFPILIQIPFLIGMFDLLKSAFELRGASFIPGWIDNLTAPDVLFSWNYPVFFFGTSFHLLPVLLGAVMFLQQKISSPLPKSGPLTDQQKQQKMMGNIMVVVFTVMFYHFPSGLNIYWLSSTGLGIVQQWMTSKRLKPLKVPSIK